MVFSVTNLLVIIKKMIIKETQELEKLHSFSKFCASFEKVQVLFIRYLRIPLSRHLRL